LTLNRAISATMQTTAAIARKSRRACDMKIISSPPIAR
jgi:hypothetical protein